MTVYENTVFTKDHIEDNGFSHNVFSGCTFTKCTYTKSNFQNAQFSDCIFRNVHLQLIQLDGCRLHNVLFDECKIVGGEFYKCDKKLFSVQFQNSILMVCNFSDMKMKKTGFVGSKMQECYFNGTCLIESDFRDSDLEGSIFHHADLSKVDFRNAKNYSINPQSNTLTKARFSSPEVVSLLDFFDIQIS